jgi:hypothetical protein
MTYLGLQIQTTHASATTYLGLLPLEMSENERSGVRDIAEVQSRPGHRHVKTERKKIRMHAREKSKAKRED